MYGIARDEDQVTSTDSRGLLADPEPASALQDQHELVVIRLDVYDISALFENVDVTRDVLTVTQERSFDRIRGGGWVGRETMKGVFQSIEVP
jgi:hypothetical protein